ncbi:bifunctional (p)ppGpp synthetase/guanosine-3',5'-bis(diphosphate) 3'-pyrophosphohydrolase [Gammaproteobacteria bacterium]|nr:bifunctional (p)ppGpp synthetase/guanosine-3',5'-bis(diphosphate) 3'-pyrophosphohydrolase [Gammaproteobacteria bacterium]
MNDKVLPSSLIQENHQELLLKFPKDFYIEAKTYLSDKEIRLIRQAYTFAHEAHKGQKRQDGADYITHPTAVAMVLLELGMDADSICAGFMHDVLEDCDVQKANLEKLFNKDIANIVDGVSKLGKIALEDKAERNANNFQKMALAMANDVRVIVVKLCDRLHNMRTISHLPRYKQVYICKETLEIYGPLALRIGMQDVRAELEDRAFKCLHPLRAQMLKSAIKKASGGRKKIVYKIRKELKAHLQNNGILSTVQGREKSLYSVYRKIKVKHKPFSEILDVYAFRVIVNSADDCYRALGIIHNCYKPIEQRFKDYIAIPKSNGYQGLHTALLALDAIPVEVQVQTKSMEVIAEKGIAAHWSYKTDDIESGKEFRARSWMSSIVDLHKKSKGSEEFIESVKTDLFSDEVYVFTPKGNIVNLKTGATPIDFAYELHTDLGNTVVGCLVNRKEAPLNIELENGSTVEIITDKSIQVDPSWLNFVVSSKARSGIRNQLRHQKISQARKAGKVMLESELKRSGTSLEEYRGGKLNAVLEMLGVKSLNQLLTDLGLGKRTGNLVAERFYEGLQIRKDISEELHPVILSDNKIEGVSVRYAKCCMPIPGDPITAHSDTERGIVVHHARCQQVAPYKQTDSRYLDADWGGDKLNKSYTAHLMVIAENKIGILADVISTFTKRDINIIAVNTKDLDIKFTECNFEIDIDNVEELRKIMQKVRSMKFVESCKRIINDSKTLNQK